MMISELNLGNIRDVICEITSLKSNENIVEDVYIVFNQLSIKNLDQLISTGTVTRKNQELAIDSLLVKVENAEVLTQGRSPWEKTKNGFALSTKTFSLPHFSGKFRALVTHKLDSDMFYAIEFTISNFSLDFKNSHKNILQDDIAFDNIEMIVYPGKISVSVLED